LPSLLFAAANSLGGLEHRKTRDAGLLFRIRKGLSSFKAGARFSYPQKSADR